MTVAVDGWAMSESAPKIDARAPTNQGDLTPMRPVSTALITAFALTFSALVGVTGVTIGAQNPGGSPEGKKMVNPAKATPDSIAAG